MISFDILSFLFWVAISILVPGAILGLGLFKKYNYLEKILMGFSIALIILPLIPFFLYLILGIKYSFSVALFSIAIIYIGSIAIFILRKGYNELKIPTISVEHGISVALFLILILTYLVRIGSYSPVFQELDPYFYVYPAQQLITDGENIPNDKTAWYPDVEVNHRTIPAISYLEAIWYSLYTGGNGYDNLLLSLIGGMYPPIAAVLAVFFIYLLVSTVASREYGLIAAGIASFLPIFIYKLAAGEMEVQPYAFFSMMFLFSMYAIMIVKKDLKYAFLAGLGFAAISLGSSSQILALGSLLIFLAIQSILFFIKKDNTNDLEFLLKSNAIVFLLGPVIGSFSKNFFLTGAITFSIAAPFLAVIVFIALLTLIKKYLLNKETSYYAFLALVLVGLIVYSFTPIGDSIKSIGKSGFAFASFNHPLDRTIAEQGLAPGGLEPQLGFISYTPNPEGTFFEVIFYYLFLPFSIIANILFNIIISLLNIVLGASVEFDNRATSLSMVFMVIFWISICYSFYRFFYNDEDNLFLLIFAIIMPPFIVGMLKAKYTIYAGVMLAIGIGFALSTISKMKIPSTNYLFVAIGVMLLLGQFFYGGFAQSLVLGSLIPLYQNNPTALAEKFQTFCDASKDPTVCEAAADPIGYANKGVNYQYDSKLCFLSIYSDYGYLTGAAPLEQSQIAFFRCQRISDYWIQSMEWIKNNTEPDASITSWWDYGHWENFFAQRNAVIRNDHVSPYMIGETADSFLDGTPTDLIKHMKSHDSKYVLFDVELVAGGGMLGGKYGALNYLSCAWNNETTVDNPPGISKCEADHLWEIVYVSGNSCKISELSNKTGLIAYKTFINGVYSPYYPTECVNPTNPNIISFCQNSIQTIPTYCVGEGILGTGEPITATYYLNETYLNGDLKLNKGIAQFPFSYPNSVHMGPVTGITILYTDDQIWLENGELKSGYEDRKGKFYDSNLYKAIFVGQIEGFNLVYSTNEVKIFKIAE